MPERKYRRQTYQKRGRKLFFFLKLLVFAFLFFVFCIVSLFIYYTKDLPRPERFIERQLFESTKIYDRTGQVLLYEVYGEERREWASLEKIPEHLQQAVIATEDANFYQHSGVDFRGIVNAILSNLKLMKPTYGGSTIPQQLIRSTFLTLDKTAERKIREIILSLELDRRYSKDQILEWYLNQVPFGRNAYGAEAASQVYFRKSVSEISLAESATLAAMIQAPSFYMNNLERLFIRKDYVLNRMASEGFISKEEAEEAKKEEISIVKFSQSIKAPHFTLWIQKQLEEKYGRAFLEQRGFKILTSLDWDLQQLAEQVVKEGVEKNKAYNSHNAALVAIDPKSGEVLAMVGSADYFGESFPEECVSGVNCQFDPRFNAAVGTQASPGRQPGSAFKPFVYATAFQKGYSDKTIVNDAPTCWPQASGSWCPRNFDGLFRGPVTLRSSLAQSLNIPSVITLERLAGYLDSIETARAMGITTIGDPKQYGLSIVLGGAEVKLLDMVSAYGVFATEGLRVPPSAILKIEGPEGNTFFENKKTPIRVLERSATRLINDILSDNEARAPMFGWRSSLYFENYQVAAKTGTSQDSRDGWVVGYTPSLVCGVWVGNNDNSPMRMAAAELLAGPTFNRFMREAFSKYPPEKF